MSAETSPGAGSGPESAFKHEPDGAAAFRSRAYAIADRRTRVRLEEGFDTVLLLGEAGIGKTTLLSSLAADLSHTHPVIHYAYPPTNVRDACARWREIETAAEESRHVVAIIDDADHLPIEVQVAAHGARLVEGAPRIQFVLGAKPSGYERFAGIAAHLDEAMARCTLGRLEDDEVAEFVAHRLGAAGVDRRHFTREALTHVAACALGMPRLVNLICAKACFVAEMNGEGRVSAASVEEAAFVLRLGDVPTGRESDEHRDAARSAA